MSDTDELATKLLKWLNKGGFPLEFRTADAARRAGFPDVRQAQHVTDPSSGKPREVDLLIGDQAWEREGIICQVAWIVECKRSDHPWVIFHRDRDYDYLPADICIGSGLARAAIWTQARNFLGPKVGPMLELPQSPGFGVIAATFGKDNESGADRAWSSLQSLATSSFALAAHLDRQVEPEDGPLPRSAKLLFPLVVTDAPLFRSTLDVGTGGLTLSRCDWGRVVWSGAEHWSRDIVIDVCTIDHVAAYFASRRHEVERLSKCLCDGAQVMRDCSNIDSRQPALDARGDLPSSPFNDTLSQFQHMFRD